MTQEVFTLKPGVTTRQVNDAIRKASAKYCEKWNSPAVPEKVERRRKYLGGSLYREEYVHGIGVPMLRSTLVASYEVGSDKVTLTFPNTYQGWSRSSSYDMLRVAIRDEIVYRSGIIDTSRKV